MVLNQPLFDAVEAILGPSCWRIDAGNAPAVLQPRRFERRADPGLRIGDEVRLTDGGFTRL